jgi:hypothetical protein
MVVLSLTTSGRAQGLGYLQELMARINERDRTPCHHRGRLLLQPDRWDVCAVRLNGVADAEAKANCQYGSLRIVRMKRGVGRCGHYRTME